MHVRTIVLGDLQVAKLWSAKEQDDTSSRGSLSSLVDLSNKPVPAAPGTSLDAANGVCTPDLAVPAADFHTSSSSSASTSPASGLFGQNSAKYQIGSAGSKSSGNDPKTQICFDFTKGVCTRGSSCKFSHDVALIVSVNSQERGICFDFLRGQCHRGLLCRFSHDLSSLAAQQCQVSQILDMWDNMSKNCFTATFCRSCWILKHYGGILIVTACFCSEGAGAMHQSAMTLSRVSVQEGLIVATHMTSTPSSTTHGTLPPMPMQHNYAMITASKSAFLLLCLLCRLLLHCVCCILHVSSL